MRGATWEETARIGLDLQTQFANIPDSVALRPQALR